MDISDFVEVAEKLNVLGIKITKDSELIAEWYSEAECRRNIYSATKSFTSCAVGFAVQEGLLSLDENMALAAQSLGLGNLVIGCIYDALHGEKTDYFSKAFQIPEGYSFQIALAVGHKTDHKAPHEYDFDKQVTIL